MIKDFNKRSSLLYVLFFFVLAFILSAPIIFSSGLPFRYDWAWPFFDLKQFWDGLVGSSSFGLFTALSRLGPAMFGLFGLVKLPPSIFFKIFILAVHFLSGYGFYLFAKRKVKSEAVAVIAGIAYSFTPYVFIRTIIGFTWSLVAYAIVPLFLLKFFDTKKKILDYFIIGLLLSLIFGQTQAGLLVFLLITSYTVIALFGKGRTIALKTYLLSIVSLALVSLPWFIALLSKNGNVSAVSGMSVTTLGRISNLAHSYRNMLMLSDHEITTSFFYPFSHDKIIMAGFSIIWFIALCALFSKKNRQLILATLLSSLAVIPFYKGPTGLFGSFYLKFYSHFPQIMVFRETYHFEFLFAITLCIMFAIGLDVIWGKIDNCRSAAGSWQRANGNNRKPQTANLLRIGLKSLFAGSAVFIIAPYLTFNYAGYLKLQQIPPEYNELNSFFQQNSNYCHKVYYPPGLDFLYFKGDTSLGASNGDSIAGSIGIPFVNGGTSVLNTPSDEMFYQNDLVTQFYETSDNGEFASLLNEGGIDCVVVRQDIDTKYAEAMGLTFEKDAAMLKKWNQNDWLAMTESKKDLTLEKQFGKNIFIFKPELDPNSSLSKSNAKPDRMGKTAAEQFSPSTSLGAGNSKLIYSLPLTDWADVNSDYRDGWSRGRYAFWRKPLFAQLRQDFIYTTKEDSVLTGKVSERGSYELWVRYLTGGTAGSWQLAVGSIPPQTADSKPPTIIKDPGEEKFVWKDLGDINIQNGDVSIKNISGENAIADIVLQPK